MVASSPYVNAPRSARTPPPSQTSVASPVEPWTCRNTCAGTRKIPEPITAPTIRRARSRKRRVRRSSVMSAESSSEDHSGLSVEEQRAGGHRRANPSSDYAATARDQVDNQHNQGDHQQKVNQATRDVEAEAQQPHN